MGSNDCDTLSVLPEKNQLLTSWDEQFPLFFLRSPDALLLSSLIPKETTEKTLSYLSIEGWLKVLCSLQPDILTEGVATQLNIQPDVSSLSPAPRSLYLVQTVPIFLVLLQKTPAHCYQEKLPWIKCKNTQTLCLFLTENEGHTELKQKGCEREPWR